MDFFTHIWDWIQKEANAWFWIIVGLLILFGMALLSDGLDWVTKKIWGIKD